MLGDFVFIDKISNLDIIIKNVNYGNIVMQLGFDCNTWCDSFDCASRFYFIQKGGDILFAKR